MKTTLNQVLLAAALALSGCTMCTPEQPAPVSDGGGQSQEVQTGDTDGGAIEQDTAPELDVLDASDVADVADADGDTTDVELADAASAEVVVGPPVPPTTECGEGVMSTPQPGDECETVGVTRCSDVGSKWVPTGLTTVIETKHCMQPNLLVCEEDSLGNRQWRLTPCPAPQQDCVKKPNLAIMTCQDYEGVASCAVKTTKDPLDAFTGSLHPCSAESELLGKTMCGTNIIYVCTTIQAAKPAPGFPWVQAYLDKYAPLKTCCPTCRYWLPYKTCAAMDIGICWGWQNPEQGVMKAPVCLENIPGKPPSCVYDCVELLKYSEEYSKPPK